MLCSVVSYALTLRQSSPAKFHSSMIENKIGLCSLLPKCMLPYIWFCTQLCTNCTKRTLLEGQDVKSILDDEILRSLSNYEHFQLSSYELSGVVF